MIMFKKLTSLIPAISCRTFHLTPRRLNLNQVKEIQIPVPWGHIAGRWWGDENKRPILALHGWQDNAGSFDALLEHFPSTRPVLAIDSPGHGLSSYLPEGQLYTNMNDTALIRRIQKYYNWDKVSFIAHSRGLDFSSVFSAMYPDDVDCLVGLDMFMPFIMPKTHMIGKLIDAQLENMARSSGHNIEYTEDEIKSRWIKATRNSLNEDSVTVLMKRGVKKNPQSGKYTFTRDHRLKATPLYMMTPEKCRDVIKNLKCHYLVIKFSRGAFFKDALKYVPDIWDVAKISTRLFELHEVEGTHHAHMDSPELIVPIITKFLERV